MFSFLHLRCFSFLSMLRIYASFLSMLRIYASFLSMLRTCGASPARYPAGTFACCATFAPSALHSACSSFEVSLRTFGASLHFSLRGAFVFLFRSATRLRRCAPLTKHSLSVAAALRTCGASLHFSLPGERCQNKPHNWVYVLVANLREM